MTKDPEEKAVKRAVDEIPETGQILPATSPKAVELFDSLTSDEQDEILRLIISDGGFDRLMEIVQANDTPGAVDLFLDRVRYYHFFRTVKE